MKLSASRRQTTMAILKEPPCNCFLAMAQGSVRITGALRRAGSASISSFDHEQKYGLPAPVDAVEELKSHLGDKVLLDVRLDMETGDLLFRFSDGINFHVFNFTGYEVWEIRFPHGSGEYSNFAK